MTKSLQELAEIRTGYHFRGPVKDQPAGTTPVLQAQDVNADLTVNRDALYRITPDFKAEPHALREGDVLFLSRGRRHWALALVDPEPGLIAPGYFFVLHPHDPASLSPGYLAWWLNTEPAQRSLLGLRRGSNIPFISLQDFSHLGIDLPASSVQRRIVAVARLRESERQLESRLSRARDRLVDLATRQAVNVRTGGER